MANDGQIVFEVTADGRQAIANIQDITRAIQRESRQWDDAAQQSTDNIGDSFSGMLKKVAAGFSAAKIGKALLDISKEAIAAASDLEEVQNVVDVTFGDSASKIESWAKAAGSQFGLTETQAKRFTSTLGAMMKSAGLSGDKIADVSTDLAGLAADMASFYNLDFDTAFQKIRSGISGETEPLKQLGINMSVANLEAFALQQGLTKTFEEMTQGEQVMLRYQYMMQATADAQGDFSRTSDGYANSVRKLQTNVESLKTTLGKGLIDTVTKATGFLNTFIEQLMPDESKRTVLDDFADIDLQAEAKIAQIESVAEEARLLTEELDKIGGSKADQAGSKVQQIASGLAEINLDQGKSGIVKDFISTLANNIDILAAVQGTDATGAKEWLEGIAESANTLDPKDAEGWQSLIASIKEGLPGLENTDFGASFFAALGDGFTSVERQSSVFQWVLESLGNKTNRTAEEQRLWLETCKRLVKTIPGLSSIINTETGEIQGGTDAVKEYVRAWEEGQKKLAMIGVLNQKETALEQRYGDLPGLELDMAVAQKRARDARKKLSELYGTVFDEEGRIVERFNNDSKYQYETGALNVSEVDEAFEAYSGLIDAEKKATETYNTQKAALDEARVALEDYRAVVEEMPGDVAETAEEATEALTTLAKAANGDAEAMTTVETAVKAANEALEAMADRVKVVHDGIAATLDSTTQGFEFIGDAAQRQAKRLEPLEKEIANLDKKSKNYKKQLADLNIKTANAKDTYGLGNLTKNMESQLRFLQEYKKDMEAARKNGFSDEFLAQFADGSVESAEWLHELASASAPEVEKLNELYGAVDKGKKELADSLTDQQLSVDQVYQTLAEKAKEAIAKLELGQDAKDNTAKTIQGIADGINDKSEAVKTAVDGILAQLNRLSGYGISVDLGGFGKITITTQTGKTEGSGRMGLDFVPHDDYIARLHEGERVLTAQENQIWNALRNGGIAGFDLETLGGVMRDNVRAGGNVYLDGRVVGNVISDRQGRSYKSLQRSGWQS